MLFINRFVTHCCCFIPLRLACVFIFIVEILFTFLGMCLGQASPTNWCWLLLRLGFMLHLIGSVMLLVGNIFKITNLLLFYLITNLLHIIFAAIYIIVWIIKCDYCFYQLCVSSVGLGNSLNQIKCKAELKIMPNELQKNKNKSSCCCCDVLSIGLLLLRLQITSFRCNFQSRAKCWQTDRQTENRDDLSANVSMQHEGAHSTTAQKQAMAIAAA
ncbi:uncharacterized protein LOC127565834 isoform X1 [Drosophila albomicans]|uniref:Uncharacterized protein LOC127565834 isoform X1 n=1 Tax=Drosophila albomicans TaxID=7291 RepID=A0A9C6T6T4_DROAB|nr:uncharacterized protein LOC127565834 isoform X1 [Drosophila albomicans]